MSPIELIALSSRMTDNLRTEYPQFWDSDWRRWLFINLLLVYLAVSNLLSFLWCGNSENSAIDWIRLSFDYNRRSQFDSGRLWLGVAFTQFHSSIAWLLKEKRRLHYIFLIYHSHDRTLAKNWAGEWSAETVPPEKIFSCKCSLCMAKPLRNLSEFSGKKPFSTNWLWKVP